MAKGNIFVLTGVNLFVGDDDPTKSKGQTLAEIKLPTLEENFISHNPGGGIVEIEIGVGIKKLDSSFKLDGTDIDLMTKFGLNSRIRQVFTVYGNIKDVRSGADIGVKAILEGRLGKIDPDAFKQGELQGHNYAINEIVRYEYYYAGAEKLFFDFFESAWRVDGVDQLAAFNANLGIGQGVS